MHKKLIYIGCVFWMAIGIGQNNIVNFDESLAASMGADEYGMKSYFLVLLQTGNATEFSEEETSKHFLSHLQNIIKYTAQKKIIVSGPVGKNEAGLRGSFIYNVATEQEVTQILQEDGAIVSGLLKAEILPWYGSAALPTYLETHAKIQKKSF